MSSFRTISYRLFEPWFLGWSRWEITTDVIRDENSAAVRSTLAHGKWKWRGRNADYVEATVNADLWWHGPPKSMRAWTNAPKSA